MKTQEYQIGLRTLTAEELRTIEGGNPAIAFGIFKTGMFLLSVAAAVSYAVGYAAGAVTAELNND